MCENEKKTREEIRMRKVKKSSLVKKEKKMIQKRGEAREEVRRSR